MSREDVGPSPSALLTTKFLPPMPGRGYVRRGRLHHRMARAASTPITLLSAPAGSGKTSLLAGWLTELEVPWAWLSIDRQDNDPGRLWAHLIAALQRLAGPIGDAALTELRRRGGLGSVDAWLTPLINDLATTTAPSSFLILDDLHLLIDTGPREAIGTLAANLPAWLHLVISTRADPPLPLPRLRADGRITELRDADLRFLSAEAGSLLAASGAGPLADEQVDLMVERTEGWAAGLQLATITLGDDADGARVGEIVGSLRPFTDYLITEVVDHLRPRMRAFLYATSIVDRVNPSLARAVSGEPDADVLLREAERHGLFLMALDGRNEWYRYHHLFAEALRHELTIRDPDAAAVAHGAAAQWFEVSGETATALEHWLAAGRPDEALRLAVDVSFALVDRGQAVTIQSIARRIPPSVPGSDPARQLAYGLLHLVFEPEIFLAWVGQASATIEQLPDPDPILMTQYLTVRAMADLSIGAWTDAYDHATAAVDARGSAFTPAGYGQRAQLQVIRAAGWLERVDDAERSFTSYVDDPRTPEPLRALVAPAAWALAAAIGGRIDDADGWSKRAAAAGDRGFHSMFSTQDLLLTRAMVARERGEPGSAVAALEMLCSLEVKPNFALHAAALVELAVVRLDQGRLDDASDALDAALHVRSGRPPGALVARRVDAVRSAICIAGGDAIAARHAAERMADGLWKRATLARSLLFADDPAAAAEMLAPLAPTTPRQLVTVEMLQAVALLERDQTAARQHAATAVSAAAASGLRQSLLAVRPDVIDLIDTVSWAAPTVWMGRAHAAAGNGNGRPSSRRRVVQLVEQPTDRELDAARFLPSRLTVPEIARELGVSTNTAKSHLKNLYRKLGVTSRDEAVDVARQLELLR